MLALGRKRKPGPPMRLTHPHPLVRLAAPFVHLRMAEEARQKLPWVETPVVRISRLLVSSTKRQTPFLSTPAGFHCNSFTAERSGEKVSNSLEYPLLNAQANCSFCPSFPYHTFSCFQPSSVEVIWHRGPGSKVWNQTVVVLATSAFHASVPFLSSRGLLS